MLNRLPNTRIILKKGTLYLKVTIPGTSNYRYKSFGFKVPAKLWDAKAEKVKPACDNASLIQSEINAVKDLILEAFLEDYKAGRPFTPALIESRLAGHYGYKNVDFVTFAKEQVADKDYSAETRRSYYAEVTKLQEFRPTIAFADINYKWLQDYQKWMRDRGNHPNTVWKSLKFLNTMLNAAVNIGGIIEKNPMKGYDRGKYTQGIPSFLKWDDALKMLEAVRTKPMPEYLRQVGWRALLSYFSGLRFADCIAFDYDKKVIEGKPSRLLLHTKKTGELVSVAFNKYITECVTHIRGHELRITNQEFNRHLRSIAVIAELSNTDISSHDMRHGFAVHCSELGASIDEVQRLLGHTKQSTTEIYFRILNKRTDEVMGRWD